MNPAEGQPPLTSSLLPWAHDTPGHQRGVAAPGQQSGGGPPAEPVAVPTLDVDLAFLDALPVAEHAAAYAALHDRLHESLSALDEL